MQCLEDLEDNRDCSCWPGFCSSEFIELLKALITSLVDGLV